MEKRFGFIFIVALLSFLRVFVTASGFSQPLDPKEITKLVQDSKKDERGPYQAIRWFCPDGTILPPDKRCPEPGGIQQALHKDAVQKIARQNGIYLGQILAGTPFTDFLDAANQNSRLKQYQMEKYLQSVDDGWIFRRARFYRGAIQAEDEEDWGLKFLSSLLTNDELLASQFFLVRQASADIPHKANDNRLQSIRALSKTIADSLPLFLDIRVKIHGQPDASDLQRVKDFRARQRQKIPAKINELLQALEKVLALAYQSSGMQSFNQYAAKLPAEFPVAEQLKSLIAAYGSPASTSSNKPTLLRDKNKALAELLWNIRLQLLAKPPAKARMAMMDLSNEVESMLFREIQNWQPATIGELLEKNYALALAAAGCGFLEVWEWEAISSLLLPTQNGENLNLEQLLEGATYARRVVEWGAGMVRANYDPIEGKM